MSRHYLRAPHGDVSIDTEYLLTTILVSYIGHPADLLAAGVADPPDMLLPGRKGIRRVDSNGNFFRRIVRPAGRLEIRRHFDQADAVAAARMPGVNAADCLVWAANRHFERTRGEGNFTSAEVLRVAERAAANLLRPHLRLVVDNTVRP